MKKHKEEIIGEIGAFLTVLMYGLWPIGANFGAKAMPQIQFLAYTTLIGSTLFFFTTFFKKEFHNFKNFRTVGWLLVYTIFIGVVPYGIMTYATRYTSAIDTGLLTQTEAIFGAIVGWWILKERIQINKLLGIILIFGANLLLLYKGGAEINWANLAISIAPVSFVFANLVAKRLQTDGMGWSPLLFFRSLVGGLILLLIAGAVEGLQMPPSDLWWFVFLFGFVLFGLEKIFWQIALRRLDISKSAALIGATPIFTFLFAYLLIDEIPSLDQWIALVLTMVGIGFILRTTSKQWEKA